MRAMRLIGAVTLVVFGLAGLAPMKAQPTRSQSEWMQPANELAGKIAEILGPGQAQFTVRNLSSIQPGEVPAIQKLLEQDLKAHAVLAGGAESANAIRVTLSENARERLWVAEVVEGSDVKVAMVHLDAPAGHVSTGDARMVLRRERIAALLDRGGKPMPTLAVLAATEINGKLVVLFSDRITVFSSGAAGWIEANSFAIEKALGRDPRGMIVATTEGGAFVTYMPGANCRGSYSLPLSGPTTDSGWSVRCSVSDDPWPVYQSADASSATALKAFFNPARNYFTGVVTPAVGVELPAFYATGLIPRAAGGAALLIASVDGKVDLIENNALRTVGGTRDWGSDFAVIRSGCGSGTQVIASSSGEAVSDSLRAFEIAGLDAVPSSGPLATDGTVTALWTAADGKSAMAVVRNARNEYEVDRVTALCN